MAERADIDEIRSPGLRERLRALERDTVWTKGASAFSWHPLAKKRARRVDPHEPEFREFQRRSEDAPRIGNDDAVPEWLTTGERVLSRVSPISRKLFNPVRLAMAGRGFS